MVTLPMSTFRGLHGSHTGPALTATAGVSITCPRCHENTEISFPEEVGAKNNPFRHAHLKQRKARPPPHVCDYVAFQWREPGGVKNVASSSGTMGLYSEEKVE